MKKIFIVIIVGSLLFVSCNNSADTNISSAKNAVEDSAIKKRIEIEERNIKVVMECMERYNAHDAGCFTKAAVDDYIEYGDGLGTPLKGKDSIDKAGQNFFKDFADVKAENLKYFADGDLVMVWGVYKGKWIGDAPGQKATGKWFNVVDIDVFKLNDEGKLLEHHWTQSFITMAGQIGFKIK